MGKAKVQLETLVAVEFAGEVRGLSVVFLRVELALVE